MDRKKLVHKLDTPFSAVPWPVISPEDQDTILELLCNLISPIGQHRRDHTTPSRGKRKKAQMKADGHDISHDTPPKPELAAFVDVGLPNVSRNLERMAESKSDSDGGKNNVLYSAIFIARSAQPTAFNAHFPQMVAVASRSSPSAEPIRLVGLSKACEDRLSVCLGIPRVSTIALRHNAPHSKALVNFVLSRVSPVKALWLEEAQDSAYRETRINTIETTVGKKKQRLA